MTLKKLGGGNNMKNYFLIWKIKTKKYTCEDFIRNKKIIKKKILEYKEKNKLMKNKILKMKKIIDKNKKRKSIIKKEKIVKSENLMEKIMISENKTIDSKEFDNYFDELPLSYLDNLENLKNKNEPIIQDLQAQINNLINEIDVLSNE